MIIKKFRKALYSDFVGYPSWFETFFDLFNSPLNDMNTALQNNLRFINNHKCDRKTVSLTHNAEKVVNSNVLSGQIDLVLVGKSPAMSAPLFWRGNGLGSVVVKASFDGAPAEPQEITLFLFE
jgi:hypothetical protein